MPPAPTVSVIIPAYNAEATIAAALDSVIQQTRPPHEIIVVDDSSTDATAQLAAAYGVRLVRQPQVGPAGARNHGVRLATGEWLAFLDADDLWPADSLATRLAALDETPDVEIVQGRLQDIWPAQGGQRLGAPRWGFNLGAALFRRAVFARVGLFEPALRQGEDIDFWTRCQEQAVPTRRIGAVTLLYRRQPDPDPRRADQHYTRLLRSVKRSLDRTRRSG